jgi:hypothetical protein
VKYSILFSPLYVYVVFVHRLSLYLEITSGFSDLDSDSFLIGNHFGILGPLCLFWIVNHLRTRRSPSYTLPIVHMWFNGCNNKSLCVYCKTNDLPQSLTNFITYCCIDYTSPIAGFELTTLVVIGTDCTGSFYSNYHTITTTTVPFFSITVSNMSNITLYNNKCREVKITKLSPCYT